MLLKLATWRSIVVLLMLGLILNSAPPSMASDITPAKLTVTAPPTGTFGTDLTLQGRATGPEGVPLAGVVVTVTGGEVPVQTTVDGSGDWIAIVAPPRSGTVTWVAATADPPLTSTATSAIAPAQANLTLAAPASTPVGAPVTLAGGLTFATFHGTPAQAPVPGAVVSIERAAGGGWAPATTTTTGTDGRYTAAIRLPVGSYALRARSAAGTDITAATSPTASVRVTRVSSMLTLSAPAKVRSETSAIVRATLRTAAGKPVLAATVRFQTRRNGTKAWTTLRTTATNAAGAVRSSVAPWKSIQVRALAGPTKDTDPATSAIATIVTTPAGAPAPQPAGAPEPEIRFPQRPQAVGAGAKARVTRIPGSVWTRMSGVTWNSRCIPRSRLRLIQVNYWGFDGYRYRGRLVVHRSVAKKTAAAFSDMYRYRYPIRQMVLPETFGRNPAGPGANDYAQMAADNTSGFNCRYVVGKEESRVMSPHASKAALDINPWENPYVTRNRVYPNPWYLNHRPASHPAILHRTDKATRALTRRGWSWGGRWVHKDYQHFQR